MGLSPQNQQIGKNYLLLIAIDNYNYWPKLNNAVRDAGMVRDILFRKYSFDGELTKELYNEKATRTEIFEELESISNQITPNDRLLIYYSGHGFVMGGGHGAWIPVDAKENSRSKHIKYSALVEELATIDCKHLLVLADACYSGSLIAV